ncbi:MAG: hypothetical protein H0W72_08640, partial [Planctomycetes bacterium]|nr:hypothetical protein [Planctomycetota bacterium]
GEVVLVDWGTAIGSGTRHSANSLAGTPLYMSPEQARRQAADERSDVYCLGATLFHLIMLRPPTWDDDPERFWQKKRIGAIDLPSAAERAAASLRLVDILLKAMAPEPERRYGGTRGLLLDLKAWQDGGAISARRDTIFDRLRRTYRRHRPVMLTAAASLAALLVIGGLLGREKLRESSTWRVVASDDFSSYDNNRFGERWQAWRIDRDYTRADPVAIDRSFWSARDGVLHGDGSSGQINNLTWNGSLTGDLRIEWAVTPETGTTNINCYIGARNRLDGYVFHLGGYAIPTAITLTKGPKAEILVRKSLPAPLEMSRSYRMCMERMDDTLRYWIDGTLVIEHRDTEMLVGPEHQAFGFECATSTVAIDDLRISTKPLPLRASPLAVADALYAERLFVSARERYQEYLTHHPDGDQVPMAKYRAARCLSGENRVEEAIAAFAACEREHPAHEVAVDAIARRAALLLTLGREDEARAAYGELARRQARPEVRSAALLDYSDWLMANRRPHDLRLDDPGLPAVIATLREGIVALARALDVPVADNAALVSCADLLNRIGSHRLVLEQYPEQRAVCASALEHLGLHHEILVRYPELTGAVVTALIQIGADHELVQLYPQSIIGIETRIRLGQATQFLDHPRRDVRALALLQLGRHNEILRDHRAERMICARTLARMGRWEEIRAEYADVAWFEGLALEQLGRWEERLAMGGDLAYVNYGLAFSRFAAGADAEGEAALATAEQQPFPWTDSHHLHFGRFVLGPTMRWRLGQDESPIESWRRWRVEHRDRLGGLPERSYAVLLGEEVSVIWGLEFEILAGVRAELAGRDDVADACYARYLAKAPDARDAVVVAFIRARRRAP